MKSLAGDGVAFTALYASPSAGDIRNDLDFLFSSINADRIIIGCDLNARHPDWGDSRSNTAGNRLKDWLSFNDNVKLTQTFLPSRVSNRSESFIDVFLTYTANINFVNTSIPKLEVFDCDSDHRVVVINIHIGNVQKTPSIEIFNFNKLNVRKFNRILITNL